MSEESRAKRAAGYAAAEMVESGMTVGIGTGTTALHFIHRLGELRQAGLSFIGVPTSKATLRLCQQAGLQMLDLDEVERIDLAVDGADEIDPKGRMIKGGGAALVREKLIATHSDEMVVVVDESKLVHQLGRFGLPVALLPFGYHHTVRLIQDAGYPAIVRTKEGGGTVVDDNGLVIVDIPFPNGCAQPERVHAELSALPGVVETGFFLTQASRLIIGYADGEVKVREVAHAL